MKATNLILSVMCAATIAACGRNGIEARADRILSQMTLEEKIGQMNQLSTFGSAEAMHDEIAAGNIGSILNETNPAVINAMQRIAVEESRLGIPLLMARDVIHGFRTIFPIPLGQAATFDPDLIYEGARIAAVEATATGIRWTFAPMVDVSRDPRWGRIAESAGEDTYLNSVLGAAMVRGFQGDDLADPTSMAACIKHFAGYGAVEGGRDYNLTNIPERQLRNTYLPPFEEAVKAGALTLMTSFNANDGIPSTGNRHLVTDILRDEWGFDGMVVTDWNSAGEMIAHGFAADEDDAAVKALDAGVDMDMMSYAYVKRLKALVESGAVKESDIDDAVRNILVLKLRLGLFENPYVDESRIAEVTYTAESLAAARRCATESAVLLKNDHRTLPLDAEHIGRIMVAGPLADAPYEQLGTWVFDGEADHTVTPLDVLRRDMGQKVVFDPILPYSRAEASRTALDAFTSKARACDAVILFLGEESILSGEAHCLTNLELRGSQRELLAAARRSGRPVVTVIMAGRQLAIADDLANTDALLYSFHPGTMGGEAIADLIFGREVPSGKLPVTFPKNEGQIPVYHSQTMTGRPASGKEVLIDDIEIGAGQTSLGCTSYYLDAGFGPLFPFGYGLSYTTFEYGDISLDKSEYSADDTIEITFDLTNTGSRDATEVAQVYVRDMVGSIARPVKELKAFARVALAAGETRRTTISLPVERLAFYGLDLKRKVEPGEFSLWVAGNSVEGAPVTFTVK